MPRRLSSSALLLTCLLWASIAAAQDPSSEYRRHSEQGVQLYQEGRYRDALAEWLAAYSLQQHPNLLLNIGQAYLRLEQPAEAIRYYVLFLQTKPHGKERQSAQLGLERARVLEAQQREAAQKAEAARLTATLAAPAAPPLQAPLPPLKEKPIYKKAWFWGIIGGVAAAGVAIGLGVGLRPRSPIPDDIIK